MGLPGGIAKRGYHTGRIETAAYLISRSPWNEQDAPTYPRNLHRSTASSALASGLRLRRITRAADAYAGSYLYARAYLHTNAHGYPRSYTDTHACPYAHTNTYTHTDSCPYTHTYSLCGVDEARADSPVAHAHAHANRITDGRTYANLRSRAYTCAYSHAYAHGRACSHADICPDARAYSHANLSACPLLDR